MMISLLCGVKCQSHFIIVSIHIYLTEYTSNISFHHFYYTEKYNYFETKHSINFLFYLFFLSNWGHLSYDKHDFLCIF